MASLFDSETKNYWKGSSKHDRILIKFSYLSVHNTLNSSSLLVYMLYRRLKNGQTNFDTESDSKNRQKSL